MRIRNECEFTHQIKIMKKIKIFFASSEELKNDRDAFGNLIRRLNKTYEKRGITLDLFEWEDYDAAFNDKRKQDEYNEMVRESDMFLAVFHRKVGRFTIEEFDVAVEEYRKKNLPKSYVYCKDLDENDVESTDLKEFKQRLMNEMGHYWSRYSNEDTMQLHFVMQLQLVETSSSEYLKVENGMVIFDGQRIANMNNLPFAALNDDFQRMSSRMNELPAEIEKRRERVNKYPDDESFKEDLQKVLDEYNKLKEDFATYQNNLFASAKRVVQLQGFMITDRMRRAMDMFNCGKIREANAILGEAEMDRVRVYEDFKNSKELTEQKRQSVFAVIEEELLHISTIMADESIEIKDRVEKTKKLYFQVDEWAKISVYDKEKYVDLLSGYGGFLTRFAYYDEAKDILERVISIAKEIYGEEHACMVWLYNNISIVFDAIGKPEHSLEYLQKALNVGRNVLGEDKTFPIYNSMALAYSFLGEHRKALDYYEIALEKCIKVSGKENESVLMIYSSIIQTYMIIGKLDKAVEILKKCFSVLEDYEVVDDSSAFLSLSNAMYILLLTIGDFQEALDCCEYSLELVKKNLGEYHNQTALVYNNMSQAYLRLGEYQQALDCCKKSLKINEKVLGSCHVAVALSCNNMIEICLQFGEYQQALEYFEKALEISKMVFVEDAIMATLYANGGGVCMGLGDWQQSLEYYEKALEIAKKVYPKEHNVTLNIYEGMCFLYDKLKEYDKALEYYKILLEIEESLVYEKHKSLSDFFAQIEDNYLITTFAKRLEKSYSSLASICRKLDEDHNAVEYYKKALEIRKLLLGEEHEDVAELCDDIGYIYLGLNKGHDAVEYFKKALKIRKLLLGEEHEDVMTTCNGLGMAYYTVCEYQRSLECFENVLKIRKRILGESHIRTVESYGFIAFAYEGLGDYHKVLEWEKKALEIRMEIDAENQESVASSYDLIGEAYQGLREYQKALEYYEKALEIRMSVLGEEHDDTVCVYSKIGFAYEGLGEYHQALDCFKKTLEIRLKVLGENHMSTSNSYKNMASVYEKLGDCQKSLEYYEKALEIRKVVLGEDALEVSEIYNKMNEVRKKIGKDVSCQNASDIGLLQKWLSCIRDCFRRK